MLQKLVIVVHDERDGAVLKGWSTLTRLPEARARLAQVSTLVICDPFVSSKAGQVDRIALSRLPGML